ncbi:MAG: hypothetical protein Q7R43_05765 [Candidatus Daviesbacteria bacterium]|nr:hypothetical protein [Candidatus Daviesbacteria bacterium]
MFEQATDLSDIEPIEHSPNTYPTTLKKGTIIPGFINAATWCDHQTGKIFVFGREILGRGNDAPDPSNSTLLICNRYGNVLEKKVVTRPNERGEQFEDWRADLTNHGTVVLGATWTAKATDGKYKAQLAWTEIPANWDGRLRKICIVPEAGYGKDVTPWRNGTRILFRHDGFEKDHVLSDYVIGNKNRLQYAGEVYMPPPIKSRFIKSGTTYAPRIEGDGTGFGLFHFQEMIGDEIVYSIRKARVHMNDRLFIDMVDLERAVTKDSFDSKIPELRQSPQVRVVYMTGQDFYNVADRMTVVAGFPIGATI